MASNTVNLNFFLAKSGVSWENIGLTKPNTECIAGQASTPVSSRPSSRSSTPGSSSPTSGVRQKAARSPIRKLSQDQQGYLVRRNYATAPKSRFASIFHIQKNSPNMTEAVRRQRTIDITRFRRYIKQRTYNLAEDAAEKAQAAADKAWTAFLEAEQVALAANEANEKAQEALEELQGEDPAPDDLSDGGQTPRWTETDEGSIDYHDANPKAGKDRAPFESIHMDEFPEHRSMLDCGAEQKAAGFADLFYREYPKRSDAESEDSLSESEGELEERKKRLPALKRKDRATEKKLSHVRSLEAQGIAADVEGLQSEAEKAAKEVRAGSRSVQSAIRRVRADRWSLERPGEVEKKQSKLCQVHKPEAGEDA